MTSTDRFDIEIRSPERVRDHGEVFTPKHIVDKMCEMVPESYWKDAKCMYLEPTCGHGNFLCAILQKRLANGISARDSLNTLWGLDILDDNIADSKTRLHMIIADYLDKSGIPNKTAKWYNVVTKCGMIIENNIFRVDDSIAYIKNKEFHKKPFAFHDPLGYNEVCSIDEQESLKSVVEDKISAAKNGTHNEFSSYFLF